MGYLIVLLVVILLVVYWKVMNKRLDKDWYCKDDPLWLRCIHLVAPFCIALFAMAIMAFLYTVYSHAVIVFPNETYFAIFLISVVFIYAAVSKLIKSRKKLTT